ncbi:MAG: hypothetical protein JO115_03445 [Pseudonocardiales bacterium]|nr:hypothetical protein [Pseudonocardiales bacterium]
MSPEELAEFETEVLAEFVLAQDSAGLADATIRSEVGPLEQVRMKPASRRLPEPAARQRTHLLGE